MNRGSVIEYVKFSEQNQHEAETVTDWNLKINDLHTYNKINMKQKMMMRFIDKLALW